MTYIESARKRFDAISDRAREAVYQKVLAHYQKHPNSPWSGAPLRDLENTIRQFYEDLGLRYDDAFRDTLPETMKAFYDTAVKEMQNAGLRNAVIGRPDSGRIKYFLDSTFEQVAMKTDNMSFQHIKALRTLSADVMRQMSVTGATRREVSRAMLDRAMQIPGFQFIDKAGKNWPLKSYFNTLARTELMNAARASYDDKVTEEGFDVMKLTTSGDSCDKCGKWEGKLFSLTGATPGLPTKQDLIADGVFHPNCTHSYSLVPDYIVETEYNEKGEKKEDENQAGTAPFGLGWGKNEPYKAKFDGVFTEQGKQLNEQMKKAGIPAETRDEINWNHTPKMQEICGENPHVERGGKITGVTPGTRDMKIAGPPDTWDGCSQTITHEYGHYVANSIFDLAKTMPWEDFESAVISDLNATRGTSRIERFIGCADDYGKKASVKNLLAKELFDVDDFSNLSLEQQWKITADADILGSISGGEFGFGHSTQVYLDDLHREAFANMYLARKYEWVDFKKKYPAMWRYMEDLLK